MVRLKEYVDKENIYPRLEFQFLMVRLKVHIRSLSFNRTIISIPYGAIKRPLKTAENKAENQPVNTK